jgi:hypothetical protein
MFTFKPAIWRNSTLYELPRPIVSVRLLDSFDFEQFKVPLAAGDAVEGRSQNGVDVSIEGQIGTQAGQLKTDEASMFTAIETLRANLAADSPEDSYELFLYHDPGSSTYRSLRGCSTVRFEYDLSDPHLFTYAVVVHATDPEIYTQAPS